MFVPFVFGMTKCPILCDTVHQFYLVFLDSHVEVVSHFLVEGKERANIICLKAVQ